MEHRSIFLFHCQTCDWSITLPRHSPLGAYGGHEYCRSLLWPITFLCAARKQVSECSSELIQSELLQPHVEIETPAALWQIVATCGQENCGGRAAVYTWYLSQASADAVVNLALELNPRIRCSVSHDMKWQAEKMQATKFDF
jgi:hypothetical protein